MTPANTSDRRSLSSAHLAPSASASMHIERKLIILNTRLRNPNALLGIEDGSR